MTVKVDFKKSNKTADRDERFLNIPELAEDKGLEIENDCRQGICGNFKTMLLSGRVEMDVADGLSREDIERNMILPCAALPTTDVTVEA